MMFSRRSLFGFLAAAPLAPLVATAPVGAVPATAAGAGTNVNTWGAVLNDRLALTDQWISGGHIRFRWGRPQIIGGWERDA